MIKLIAIDLDGTLLNSTGNISERNRQAILKAQEKGIEVVVATGRSFESANRPIKEAEIVCPKICVNGAEIYQENHKKLSSITMSKENIAKIIAITELHGAYLEIYTNKGIFAKQQNEILEILVNAIRSNHPELSEAEVQKRVNQRFQEESFLFVDSFSSILNDPTIEIVKALALCFDPQKLTTIKTALANEVELLITSSGFDNLEFNHPNAQKGIALEKFAQKRKITKEQIMAIGDNENDLSMLKYAGTSVAMANAKESIKPLVDHITTSNDQDGVALAIEAILNQN